jgi:hypothetical protein
MTAVSAPLNAAQRAQAAFEQVQQHRRDVALARSRRERARNIRLALVFTGILLVGLAATLYYGLPVWLSSAGSALKPVDSFVATGVGQIRMPYKGDLCRQVRFNNRTGRLSGASIVNCDSVVQGPGGASDPQTRSRLEAVSDAFKRR